ncbi:amino acid ABC transporter permease [Fuscibacter oryzae]|uniref:ABC transporter permease subunit n=1 Tax=Fuscibacter oryzae TaxID=2803939 RepID=A0A8J7MPG0_9RHOB|nr:ABC transporter permease subunit [Fuscibacter oryzae]MBL4926654.1 ABC transporter permease subunit [Fuscibacter oryzae]
MTLPVTSDGQSPHPFARGKFAALVEWWGPRPWSQIAAILGIAALLLWFGLNVAASLQRAGITPGFGFLFRSANFQIGESTLAFQAGDTYLRAIAVGIVNTLKVAVAGCVLATALGVAIGIGGLSANPILGGLVRFYIEAIRNTPLLLQLFFWIALARNLPGPKQAPGGAGFYLSNRGIFVPALTSASGWLVPVAVVAGLGLAAIVASRFLSRGRGLVWLAAVALSALALSALGVGLDIAHLQGFNIRGGMSLSPEFAALLTALTVKFSASIAEIVRAGILSVPVGQREAARALGLNDWQILRLVVLPQALRVIVPLITSSFLDLAKDSSLAVAIGYPDLVSILNTTANTTGQAIEAVFIMTVSFLALNLSVAALMNRYNTRVALRGQVKR